MTGNKEKDVTIWDWCRHVSTTSFPSEDPKMVQGSLLKNYNQWMANIYFSNYSDTILFADFLNCCGDMPDIAHEAFLRAVIPKKQRRFNWPKENKGEKDIQVAAEFFDLSYEKMSEIYALLPPSVLATIKLETENKHAGKMTKLKAKSQKQKDLLETPKNVSLF